MSPPGAATISTNSSALAIVTPAYGSGASLQPCLESIYNGRCAPDSNLAARCDRGTNDSRPVTKASEAYVSPIRSSHRFLYSDAVRAQISVDKIWCCIDIDTAFLHGTNAQVQQSLHQPSDSAALINPYGAGIYRAQPWTGLTFQHRQFITNLKLSPYIAVADLLADSFLVNRRGLIGTVRSGISLLASGRKFYSVMWSTARTAAVNTANCHNSKFYQCFSLKQTHRNAIHAQPVPLSA